MFRRDVAGDGHGQVVLGEALPDEGGHVVPGDGADAFHRAAGAPAIGMIGERRFIQRAAGQEIRVALVAADLRQDPATHPLDRFLVEPGLGQGQPGEIDGLVLGFHQRMDAAVEPVGRRGEADGDGVVGQTALEFLAVIGTGALVQHGRGQVGQTFLAGGIGFHPALEEELDRQQRNLGVLDQPGFDAAGADHALDVDR